MNFKKYKQAFLSFSYSERRAIRGLLIIVALLLLINALMPRLIKSKNWNYEPYQALMDSLEDKLIPFRDSLPYVYSKKTFVSKYFYQSKNNRKIKPFNPNLLNTEGWMILGLSQKQANAVITYKNKKGGFYSLKDLQEVHVLSDYFLQKISPYLLFSADTTHAENSSDQKIQLVLDINRAERADWEQLQGIDNRLAARIINYREKLGGFHSITQVGEVWGVSQDLFKQIQSYITLTRSDLRQIQLNYASASELAMHPYIDFKLANAIVRYRNAKGFFKHVQELLDLGLVDSEQYDKLAPYFTIQ
ncbi:MAG: helix-hairpin-helix domain-containing protein [Flavobacteriales bacterium]|nr:helix-hairpin-helix domain-containing protein [Flavobacteriales bacterium]MCZ2443433.1 helix-hairpin-helix domain-containing protein [Flavobacteriales bacterium]